MQLIVDEVREVILDIPGYKIKFGKINVGMAQKVLELYLGLREPDDKDHYQYKRLKLAGELFTSLFRVAFLNFVKDISLILRTRILIKQKNFV